MTVIHKLGSTVIPPEPTRVVALGVRPVAMTGLRALDGRTSLVVAHRLTQAATADRIVVLDTGRVFETGPHAEPATGEGPYAHLWAAWSQARTTRGLTPK